MNLDFNPDQRALLDAVERIAQHHEGLAVLGKSHYEISSSLQADLDGVGIFEAASIDELGPVAATAMILRLARLPQCVELVASALVLPLLAPEVPRTCAVLWDHRERPARWLPGARAAICVRGDSVQWTALDNSDVAQVDSPYGYPVGRLTAADALAWQTLDVDANELRRLWRIGVAAEIAGCLDAGLQTVVTHVRDRRQFGRPLGAFQAIQHRLAGAAVQVEAARWLALQAAHSASHADAASALAHAQQCTSTVVYDLHQFMGAMGLTLEHPLHRWTTRVKMLRADLGGAHAQQLALAAATWATEASA
ncbi:acyl-CoA dehydrogenase family protein [Caenimonas sp. SL110]|uniref:acyl-CoA dehydrogenase family protein n=1 Tax=Caenimonas sp. SL110 TaxID=1450524 RepID=UPI000652B2C7|nr:acyl-CoA dehydrogenase family protein [Caenimonas sp. SL110]